MEIALLIAFVVSNTAWLFFTFKNLHEAKSERRELLNRIADPKIIMPHEKVIEYKIKQADISNEALAEFAKITKETEEERAEYDSVGTIDDESLENAR